MALVEELVCRQLLHSTSSWEVQVCCIPPLLHLKALLPKEGEGLSEKHLPSASSLSYRAQKRIFQAFRPQQQGAPSLAGPQPLLFYKCLFTELLGFFFFFFVRGGSLGSLENQVLYCQNNSVRRQLTSGKGQCWRNLYRRKECGVCLHSLAEAGTSVS